ncbi:IMP cyclohydrolase [Cohnella sp.]|uniref:IMP cyclohydrolase n=1 Tax=Cohnella sp. TaxID=1883426 RepID=UPI00356347A3
MKLISFEDQLFNNPYPGRTIIIGMTPSGANYVQVYWIMGRSANSRNRVFETDQLFVKNSAFEPTKMVDPSLIIYYPIKHLGKEHIVSNGDQTDTIIQGLQSGRSFENALQQREFEPDAPHYTPRISGIMNIEENSYCLSILKTRENDPSICLRYFFHYDTFTKGIGHCIHTYRCEEDGVLRPFVGEPFEMPLFNTVDDTANYYWNNLNKDNRISLLVKFVSVENNEVNMKLINKHLEKVD